jgi:hypothetical protein
MPLNSAEASVSIGLGTAAAVWTIYNTSLPSIADVRSLEKQNIDIVKAERTAAWMSALLVTGVALITSDPTVFVIGGAAMVAFAWWYRHADQVDPLSGVAVPKQLSVVPGGLSEEPVSNDVIYVDEQV